MKEETTLGAAGCGLSIQPRAKDKRGMLDPALADHVDADELEGAWAIREGSRHFLVVYDHRSHDRSRDQTGVQARVREALNATCPNLLLARREKLAGKFVLLCVTRVSGEPGDNVLGVVGV